MRLLAYNVRDNNPKRIMAKGLDKTNTHGLTRVYDWYNTHVMLVQIRVSTFSRTKGSRAR